ncbi:MAG: leucine-rich repeat protein, partial [Alistipes sp.]|nr:leucine-rich repeat protein [Alistipes sp.]
GCSSLTTITIPDSVKTIGDRAFQSCSSLKEVYCKSLNPPSSLGWHGIFGYRCPELKIYIPHESVDKYKSHPDWKKYADNIEGYDFEE